MTKAKASKRTGSEAAQVTGRLMAVDWGAGRADLYTPLGIVTLMFEPELGDTLQELARRMVVVRGRPVGPDSRPEACLVADEIVASDIDDQDFWKPLDVDELAREQGVGPFTYEPHEPLDDGEDIDAFLDAIFA